MNILLAPAIALAAAITLAVPVQADEADDHYLQLLQQMGTTNINVPLARQQAIESCVMLGDGYTMAQTVDDLARAGGYPSLCRVSALLPSASARRPARSHSLANPT